jgi:hypothetical protein
VRAGAQVSKAKTAGCGWHLAGVVVIEAVEQPELRESSVREHCGITADILPKGSCRRLE